MIRLCKNIISVGLKWCVRKQNAYYLAAKAKELGDGFIVPRRLSLYTQIRLSRKSVYVTIESINRAYEHIIDKHAIVIQSGHWVWLPIDIEHIAVGQDDMSQRSKKHLSLQYCINWIKTPK